MAIGLLAFIYVAYILLISLWKSVACFSRSRKENNCQKHMPKKTKTNMERKGDFIRLIHGYFQIKNSFKMQIWQIESYLQPLPTWMFLSPEYFHSNIQ